MASPTPKPAATRQRRNRTATNRTIEANPASRRELPNADTAHEMTREWWTTIWASPIAHEWVDADVPGLMALAVVFDTFWKTGDLKAIAEYRMQIREYGLSPMSRRSLQWEIKRVEAPTAPAPPTRSRDPRLRAIG